MIRSVQGYFEAYKSGLGSRILSLILQVVERMENYFSDGNVLLSLENAGLEDVEEYPLFNHFLV